MSDGGTTEVGASTAEGHQEALLSEGHPNVPPRNPSFRPTKGLRKAASHIRRSLRQRKKQQKEPASVINPEADNERFRIPTDLRRTATPPLRVLVIGQCLLEWLSYQMCNWGEPHEINHLHFNNFSELPENPPQPAEAYSFQIIQLPLRQLVPDQSYFQLSYEDPGAWDDLFLECQERMRLRLQTAMRYNLSTGLLTFVTNFLVPQQNPIGRLLTRGDKRNMVNFVATLNDSLSDEVSKYPNAYVIDIDQIAATYGKKYVQGDVVGMVTHSGELGSGLDEKFDQARIEPLEPLSRHYSSHVNLFERAIWNEIESMFRVVRGLDAVKLVIVDLDDTLWRGVIMEEDEVLPRHWVGWPRGVAEALSFLKKRGVLLAIVSKNDEEKIVEIWDQIFKGLLLLSDFAIRRINWSPKDQNVEEVLQAVNVLPEHVVFVDDNPVERAAVRSRFPEIRVLGDDPWFLRRILLWSPETQVSAVSTESTRRTEMVRGQVDREEFRQRVSREAFLQDLKLRVRGFTIENDADPRWPRCLELINKTNQFNTTGKRWTEEDVQRHFSAGGSVRAFEVEDRFTLYGLVVVVVLHSEGSTMVIDQFVMSCRVLGLDVEAAVMATLTSDAADAGFSDVGAGLVRGERNHLSWDLFERFGFIEDAEGRWMRNIADVPASPPGHITVLAK